MVFGGGIDKLGVRVAHCLKVSLIIDVVHSKANIILLATHLQSLLILASFAVPYTNHELACTTMKIHKLTIVLLSVPSAFYVVTVTFHITMLLQSEGSRARIYQRGRFLYRISRVDNYYNTTHCRNPAPQNMSNDNNP